MQTSHQNLLQVQSQSYGYLLSFATSFHPNHQYNKGYINAVFFQFICSFLFSRIYSFSILKTSVNVRAYSKSNTFKKNKIKAKLYTHIYHPLISKELFDVCQDIRKGRGRQSCNENITNPFIFRGLVTCAKCGRIFTPELKKGKYVYLRPNPKDGCDCKPINENVILKQIEEVLKSFELKEVVRNELLVCLKKTNDTKKETSYLEVSVLRKQFDKNKVKLNNLLDLRLDGSITKDEYDKKKIEIEEEQEGLRNKMDNVEVADERFAITLEYLIDLTSRAYELFKSSGISEKRKLINFVFPNLQIEGKNPVISIRKPFDKLVNLSKGLPWLG